MDLRIQKILSITGSLLINFLSRPTVYWGNMTVYVMSYHLQRGNLGTLINNAWYWVFYNIGWTSTMLSNEVLSPYIKPKYQIFMGMILFNFFFFGSAFYSGDMSWTAYIIVFPAIVGSGLGMFESLVLKHYILEWTNSKGMITSLYVASSSAGAAVANQFITWCINPRGLTPNLQLGNFLLFSDEELANRVPTMFLVMGIASVVLQFTGFCLLKERCQSTKKDDSGEDHDSRASGKLNNYNSFKHEPESESKKAEMENNVFNGENDFADQDTILSQSRGDDKDETIIKFICRRDFQKLFFIYSALGQSLEVSASFYKVYGSLWIENDHFFSDLGTVMVLPGIVSNVLIGMCLDKYGLKLCFIVISALLSFLSLLMYFSAMLDQTLYFVTTVLVYTFSSGMYSCVMASTVILFGNRFLSRNLALVSSASIVTALSASSVTELLVQRYGWFGVFAWVSSLSLAALIVVTVTFPEHGAKELKLHRAKEQD